MEENVILSVKNLKQYFEFKSAYVKAVNGVSFDVKKGEILALAGESGCGKSTTAKCIMGLNRITSGEIYFKGNKISDRNVYRAHSKDIHKNLQIVFQDSASALNPKMRIKDIIAEPLRANNICTSQAALDKRVESLMEQTGLDLIYKDRYPYELSGGQRQRAAIARSISTSPDLIIADEPIASLDVSIQAQIVNLFKRLQREHGFSFIFIAHDLSVVKYISDRTAVMLKGRIVEMAPTTELFKNPLHGYTKALISAVPLPDPIYERNKKILEYDFSEFNENGRLTEVLPEHFVYK
ncbi:ATP-binding cassette domain-containing protein [Lachnospiraceae bacterium NSJ-143]|nr:ATP-binding cassette domain-containing protein [Lachnospiraceae bacterium NSJ-143]